MRQHFTMEMTPSLARKLSPNDVTRHSVTRAQVCLIFFGCYILIYIL